MKEDKVRLLGRDNRGGIEYKGHFTEDQLEKNLGYSTAAGELPLQANQLIPKVLQRLKCKAGAFVLENKGTTSRGSSRSSSRPTSKKSSRVESEESGLPSPSHNEDGKAIPSDLAKRFDFAEILDIEEGESHVVMGQKSSRFQQQWKWRRKVLILWIRRWH